MITRTFRHLAACIVLSACFSLAYSQTPAAPPADPSGPGALATILSPDNIAPAAFLLSNIADAKTDWHLTVGGKAYTVTPAQRLSIAGGSIFASLAIRHYYPRAAKPINIALTVATCYFAGRAYANTYNHGDGAPAGPAPTAKRSALAFAVRLH
jgi:hypothetical protein